MLLQWKPINLFLIHFLKYLPTIAGTNRSHSPSLSSVPTDSGEHLLLGKCSAPNKKQR